jgi:hypothetical protein
MVGLSILRKSKVIRVNYLIKRLKSVLFQKSAKHERICGLRVFRCREVD